VAFDWVVTVLGSPDIIRRIWTVTQHSGNWQEPMQVSYFTPTHNPEHLARLADSLEAQTCGDYEWIVVPNNGVTAEDVQRLALPKACRLRIVEYVGKTLNIGELKNFAASQGTGQILAEVDHDDELVPECTQELISAFESDQSLDFAYSHCLELADGKSNVYAVSSGWDFVDYVWKGVSHRACRSFDPDPKSFCKIWWAPNHVRAWRSSFYHRIGGHDKELRIADDHDIMCRTYIEGKVQLIEKVLYVYHYTGSNVSKGSLNGDIQVKTLELHDKYIEGLVDKWSQLIKKPVVDLRNFYSVVRGEDNWPWSDDSVACFKGTEILQNVSEPQAFMESVWRSLIPGGWFLTTTPSTDGRGAWQDPRHTAFWNQNSFWYYTRKVQAQLLGTTAEFQASRLTTKYPSEWHEQNKIPYVRADLIKSTSPMPGLLEVGREELKRRDILSKRREGVDLGKKVGLTIVTPTIGRKALIRACRSVNEQTYTDWQHIVIEDGPSLTPEMRKEIEHPQRTILVSGEHAHDDVGNYCRQMAYDYLQGEHVLHLDDDNYYAHPEAFDLIKRGMDGYDWGVFPMLMRGELVYNDPPGRMRTDQNQIVYRPVIDGKPMQFPKVPDYDADGIFCEQLMRTAMPRMLAELGPLAIGDKAYTGIRFNGEDKVVGENYADSDLTFFLNVYRDYDRLAWCLPMIRSTYPGCRIIVISDGDPYHRYETLCEEHGVEYTRGMRLFGIANAGTIVGRMFDAFLRKPTRYLFRVDTDTEFHHRFQRLPEFDYFGTADVPRNFVQGGCVGLSKDACTRLHSHTNWHDPKWGSPRDYTDRQPVWERAELHGLVSFDWILATACKELGIVASDYSEVCSNWMDRPSNLDAYAVSHPCKSIPVHRPL
jgi:O-antigen biosynthesis protein